MENGYFHLPPGKIANAVTWMERIGSAPIAFAASADFATHRLSTNEFNRYRRIFAAVGEPWLWSGHLEHTEAGLRARLDSPAHEIHAAMLGGRDVGILEMDFSEQGHGAGAENGAEIAYFGLTPGEGRRGLGRALMNVAIGLAVARNVDRLWLHTCNFDDAAAILFYRACGFEVYAQGFEIMDDPRVRGLLPADAAPHVPMVRGTAPRPAP